MLLEDLVKHAEKYGIDGITDTAIEAGYGVEELAKLIERMDAVETALLKKISRYNTPKRHRLTYEERAKRLLGIEDEENG